MSAWNDPELLKLFLADTPLIDVRAPVEFTEGSLPNAFNLPIINNEERAMVGTCYKNLGQAAAIKLGHELVSGNLKQERIAQWIKSLKANPETQIFCFRGGLRSQIACQWIAEAGINRIPIQGGYKRMRRFFLSKLDESPLPSVIRLSGYTGSGKTETLKKITQSIDLEKIANHRGSAFGELGIQPSQINFENELSLALMKASQTVVVEDESAMIGKITIPKRFYFHMKNSPSIILRCSHEDRIQNIFEDYVVSASFDKILYSFSKISKRLGGVRYTEVECMIKKAIKSAPKPENHAEWISALLKSYYDPFYEKDLKRQSGQIIFEGTSEEILEFIKSKNLTRS